jgi:AcrR family transcriptional regulator
VLLHGYEAVAVGDVIRHVRIGRSTFYLHFSSKRNLLEHSLDTLCTRLVSCVDRDAIPEHLVSLMEHFRQQRHLNRVFFDDPIRSIWVRRLASMVERTLRRHPVPPRKHHSLPRSLVALTIAETQIALITHWLRSAGSVPPERIAAAILANTRALLGGS